MPRDNVILTRHAGILLEEFADSNNLSSVVLTFHVTEPYDKDKITYDLFLTDKNGDVYITRGIGVGLDEHLNHNELSVYIYRLNRIIRKRKPQYPYKNFSCGFSKDPSKLSLNEGIIKMLFQLKGHKLYIGKDDVHIGTEARFYTHNPGLKIMKHCSETKTSEELLSLTPDEFKDTPHSSKRKVGVSDDLFLIIDHWFAYNFKEDMFIKTNIIIP